MQISNPTQIPNLAQKTGFSIFSFPRNFDFNQIQFKNALIVEPEKDKKNSSGEIKKEQITDLIPIINNRQTKNLNILIKSAERMNEVSFNVFLKNLEEPIDNIHIIFLTHNLQQIPVTVRSRAFIYRLKNNFDLDSAPNTNSKNLDSAKTLLTTNPKQLIQIAEKLHKTKDNSRPKTLEILDIAIELAYKTYFKTFDSKWLKKLEQLTKTYDRIEHNGHIKLQLIANML